MTKKSREVNVGEQLVHAMSKDLVAHQILERQPVSAEVDYVVRTLPPRATREVIASSIIAATHLPWSAIARPEWSAECI
jgi:hypothetical protein